MGKDGGRGWRTCRSKGVVKEVAEGAEEGVEEERNGDGSAV